MTRAENAVANHKNFYPCSAAVMCAFADIAGISEENARKAAMPFAGGKMGKCGAVLAAEYIIERAFPGRADELKERLENEFLQMNSSVQCAELKGRMTGKPLRSCRGCVTDAAELLERMLEGERTI